jgi:hypothetical protein
VYAFRDRDALLAALRDVPRNELGVEYLGLNRTYLERLQDRQDKSLPAWSLVVGFEGRSRHVAYQEGKVRDLFATYDCAPADDLAPFMIEQLDQPWMEASQHHTAFFGLFSRMADHDSACNEAAERAGLEDEDIGKVIVALDLGRAAYAVYDWFSDTDHTQAIEDLNLSLADQGAFFGRPHGSLGRKIFASIPNHLPVLKCIKGFMDPDNILNPDRTLRDEDEAWKPASVMLRSTSIGVWATRSAGFISSGRWICSTSASMRPIASS